MNCRRLAYLLMLRILGSGYLLSTVKNMLALSKRAGVRQLAAFTRVFCLILEARLSIFELIENDLRL